MHKLIIFILGVLEMSACHTTKEEFEVTDKTVAPATSITWVGHETALVGDGQLRVGEKFPEVVLTNLKMEAWTIGNAGQVRVIDVIPSIDTPVCEQQTHILSENKQLHPGVERVTISADLPYAQRRFMEEAKLNNVNFYSDYREGQFAKVSGLQIKRNGLLARAVIVLDQQGVIRHLQIVPEITNMPDMAKAFSVANQLVR